MGNRLTDSEWRQMQGLEVDGSDFSAALENGSVTVTSGGKTVWTSPPEYSIVSYLKADIDRDGNDELLLLLDKKGKYGPVRPFWVDAEEGNFLCLRNNGLCLLNGLSVSRAMILPKMMESSVTLFIL